METKGDDFNQIPIAVKKWFSTRIKHQNNDKSRKLHYPRTAQIAPSADCMEATNNIYGPPTHTSRDSDRQRSDNRRGRDNNEIDRRDKPTRQYLQQGTCFVLSNKHPQVSNNQ